MSRVSSNQYCNAGKLINGYDYENQCWVLDGKVQRCGHPDRMQCDCYGRIHEGEESTATEADLWVVGVPNLEGV